MTSKPHSSGEMWGLWKLRRYGGNAVLGEREANELVDAYDRLKEQLEVAHAALRGLVDWADGNNGSILNTAPWAVAREALNPASRPRLSIGLSDDMAAELGVGLDQKSDGPPPASSPASSLDDIDPKDLGDGMEATVEPGDPMTEDDLDAFDPAKERS